MTLSLKTLAKIALPALALTAALSQPVRADLVIKGRAAQALHCAAMLYMVSDTLYEAGLLDYSTANSAQENAVRMLDYVPGTDDQKVQAMGQRFDKLMRTRSLNQLLDEYNETSAWCNSAFL
ncbi:hypothetical protein [Tabrizicola fusiformis]|uniref:hypothetical protein n=1 Tax=Tabrizicola sp. SY72 TaxID=2741673 RepID=UPI0015744B53|nr:hypothetical protein [Tabrizicola sp. SY72]NTT85813.1 hypothetical protein [Tabrizicola sp. SY72]